jgi:hypothetical protein
MANIKDQDLLMAGVGDQGIQIANDEDPGQLDS